MTSLRRGGVTEAHLDLVVLIYLLAGARGRRETNVLEGDLTLRLPAGTEEERRMEGKHVGKSLVRIALLIFTFLHW